MDHLTPPRTTAIIHVVDDDDAVRDSLRFLLEPEGWTVRTYGNAMALLDTELGSAGCVLTDFHMPEIDGLELQARLAARGTLLPVIVITGHGDVSAAVRAMRAGAVDFLEKPFSEEDLMNAIRRALEANRCALAASAGVTQAARRIAGLTPREREVLDLLVTGKSNKEMALVLGTSPRTIDVHRARVFQKLDADSIPDLVHLVLAARQGQSPS
ncbi:MAG TPA: response regulator [Acetobacteraceae bacterium]|jgi:two-component system response regulator FixJ|nr:response regulator [Acetobacteraceae bacterium]